MASLIRARHTCDRYRIWSNIDLQVDEAFGVSGKEAAMMWVYLVVTVAIPAGALLIAVLIEHGI